MQYNQIRFLQFLWKPLTNRINSLSPVSHLLYSTQIKTETKTDTRSQPFLNTLPQPQDMSILPTLLWDAFDDCKWWQNNYRIKDTCLFVSPTQISTATITLHAARINDFCGLRPLDITPPPPSSSSASAVRKEATCHCVHCAQPLRC